MNSLRSDRFRSKTLVKIFINGKVQTAYEGETVLAALVASGYKTLRFTPKTGAPRGALCGMGVCYECLVTIDRKPSQRACMTEVADGMEVLLDEV